MIDALYRAARPALFRVDPERVHDGVIAALGRASTSSLALDLMARSALEADPRLAVRFGGVTLPGPVGVAAGLDKNAVSYPALCAMGWDLVEVGTITPQPQTGNPKPRLFRLRDDTALINRMGFPGDGADTIATNLVSRRRRGATFGVNIGPNGSSVEAGLEAVVADCSLLASRFASLAGYLVVNVSSPNTARLRELQGKEALQVLLTEVKAATRERGYPPAADTERGRSALHGAPAAGPAGRSTPLLVKISPDLSPGEISDIIAVALDVGLDGIVATNTTVARPPMLRGRGRGEAGGLSGRPLRERALGVVRQIARETDGKMPIVAVGGIASGADALEAIRAGAWAVQVYTGLIYEGPGLARRIKRDLIHELDRTGVATLAELRGQPA